MTRRKSKFEAELPADFKLLSVRSVGVGHIFRNAETLHGFQKEETDLTTSGGSPAAMKLLPPRPLQTS